MTASLLNLCKIVGYICDDRFLVKPVESAVKLLPDAEYEPPYEGANEMILVDAVDDREFLEKLITEIYAELPEAKPKKFKVK